MLKLSWLAQYWILCLLRVLLHRMNWVSDTVSSIVREPSGSCKHSRHIGSKCSFTITTVVSSLSFETVETEWKETKKWRKRRALKSMSLLALNLHLNVKAPWKLLRITKVVNVEVVLKSWQGNPQTYERVFGLFCFFVLFCFLTH